jgi:hypothetical protein
MDRQGKNGMKTGATPTNVRDRVDAAMTSEFFFYVECT